MLKDYSELLKRKKCQDVLNGKTIDLYHRKLKKIDKLNMVQTEVIDKCLKENNWELWSRIEKEIEKLKFECKKLWLFVLAVYEMDTETGMSQYFKEQGREF